MLHAVVAAAAVLSDAPQQIHTALGVDTGSLSVSWATGEDVRRPHVEYWVGGEAKVAAGDSRVFSLDPGRTWYTHVAYMTGLETNTEYTYRVGDATGVYSANYTVMNRRKRSAGDPYRHIIFGDMGASNAYSLCTACTGGSNYCNATTCAQNTTVGLVAETETADMFLHVGDFAYNLDTANGTVGDIFMNNIEQIAARNVYMVSHGNHEDSRTTLAHYIERFRNQPSNAVPRTFYTANGGALNTLYFSWDHGLVHYVSMSTELFFGVKDNSTNLDTFTKWLEADLEAANKNRAAVPWVIVQGHRSIYCTCDFDCTYPAWKVRAHMQPILFKYGVDFFINGHEHNYERTWPLHEERSDRSNVDPKATIYIVSGAAGSHELHEPFRLPQPKWSAFRSNSFSYSRMLVYNSTHIHWQQVQTDPTEFPLSDYGRVIDDFWVVQHSHGPFDKATAPQMPAGEPCRDELCESHDHWEPLLGIERRAGEKFSDSIERFRATAGEAAWQAKLRGLMAEMRGRARKTVRGDGDKEFKWRRGDA